VNKSPFRYFILVSCLLGGFLLFPKEVSAKNIQARGNWYSVEGQTGTVTMDFDPGGGAVNGTFTSISGGKYKVTFGGRFWGNFTGGRDGTFSGQYEGWFSVPGVASGGGPLNGNVGGPWKGTISSDGTISAHFTNTTSAGEDGRATLSFPMEAFDTIVIYETPQEQTDAPMDPKEVQRVEEEYRRMYLRDDDTPSPWLNLVEKIYNAGLRFQAKVAEGSLKITDTIKDQFNKAKSSQKENYPL
jgi:hypothetical protein